MKPLVVIGDVLLDRDLSGRVDRLCPDEPAPVFDESRSVDRPGGAALAAALAAASGREVRLIAGVGKDAAGQRLRELLAESNVELLELEGVPPTTPEKIRLRQGSRTVLRLDRNCDGTSGGEPGTAAQRAMAEAGAVLVSDYGRGTSRGNEIRRLIAAAAAIRPVVWDPHPRGASPVPGLRLVVPNEREIPGGTGESSIAAITAHALAARREWRSSAVAVTLAERGALLVDGGSLPLVVRPPFRTEGDDACGAGDRFAGEAAGALADGAMTSEAVQQAVEAATTFVASGGASGYTMDTRPQRKQGIGLAAARRVIHATRSAGGTVVATGGCFDLLHAGHIATLQAARALGDCLVVCLNSDTSVRSRKGFGRPITSEQDRARLLLALECVDAVVIFDDDTPVPLIAELRPDVWVKGGDYNVEQMPEADHVTACGGQAVVVPYLAGRSTTQLISNAAERSVR
jgi:rfaE bifunctional protein nucleotidyltransferase chain/domain/rfaE bifunctional protein kinase chain/domain